MLARGRTSVYENGTSARHPDCYWRWDDAHGKPCRQGKDLAEHSREAILNAVTALFVRLEREKAVLGL